MNHLKSFLGVLALALIAITGCEKNSEIAGPAATNSELALETTAAASALEKSNGSAGAVYTMTNATSGNEVAVFNRAADGMLTAAGNFATGGLGTGGGLGNQGAVRLAYNNRLLFVCNAGSNDISVFAVRPGLSLLRTVPSGGQRPVSLTIHGNLLYVLNAGGSGNISGFNVNREGGITPIANSTQPLSGAATGPAQVEFNPRGNFLVVTEKATNRINTYSIGANGLASGPIINSSASATPFGFAFDRRGFLIVSEAVGGAPNASVVSSYNLSANGNLQVVSGSVGTNQTAACWIVITNNGRFAYASNTGSGSISGFRIRSNGSLSLLTADGRTGVSGGAPIDMVLSGDNRFLYALGQSGGEVVGFRVGSEGNLTPIGSVDVLPAFSNGLASD